MSVEPSPPDYSTVIVKEDPPPPYPGFEDAPPPYPGIVSQDITLLISDERDHSNNRGCRCTCTSRPLTPRIVAWCDMVSREVHSDKIQPEDLCGMNCT